jgi:hypothetical protein
MKDSNYYIDIKIPERMGDISPSDKRSILCSRDLVSNDNDEIASLQGTIVSEGYTLLLFIFFFWFVVFFICLLVFLASSQV